MKPEDVNRAIAEHCGWREDSPNWWIPPGVAKAERCPNYHADLNAMHEAEKMLTDEQFGRYCFSLQHLYLELSQYRSALGAISATAPQRAEAFLRTIGKWNDQ